MDESRAMLRRLLPVNYPSVILGASSNSQGSGVVSGSIGLPIFTIEEVMVWIELFERKSFTTYNADENWTHDGRKTVFKRKFQCNHRATDEPNEKPTCKAFLEFTIKDNKENMATLDCYWQDHPAQVTIDFCHNHIIGIKNAPPSEKLSAIFRAYFAKGHSPLTAHFCHKCDLHSFYDAEFYNVISQESVCPSINWCYQEYEKLFKQKYMELPETELLHKLKASIETYNGKNAQKCAVLIDNPLVLSICTPLMKQVFNSGFADGRIIVRTLSSSKAGQKCPNLVLFLGLTPMGPFPFGMVFTWTQNKNVICGGIRTLFECLGSFSYNPQVIIVDQNCAITDGLKNIFPLSEIVFNNIQILQSIWRSLRLAHDDHTEFLAIYNSFLGVLNSKSSQEFEDNAETLNIYAQNYSKMYNLVRVFQTCAKRNVEAGYELNVHCMDGGTLMLQDVCIKYGNVFNILQTFDFVTENYMHHYERKLGKIVQGDLQGFFKTNFYASPDETANFTCQKITNCEFVVNSLKTDFFINSELNTCTCQILEYGRSCIHQYVAEKHLASIPECYHTLAIDSLHDFQTILSYKIHYYSHDIEGTRNGTYEDSAAFGEIVGIIRHRDNENSNTNSSSMGIVNSQSCKLEGRLFCVESTDFVYQTDDVDVYKDNSYGTEQSKNIVNIQTDRAAPEIAKFPDFDQSTTFNEIDDFSSKYSETQGSEVNQITTLQSSETDCNFEEGLHLLEESHIKADPNSLINTHLKTDSTPDDLHKVFKSNNKLEMVSYKPSKNINSKPKCYINKKSANLKRGQNDYQYGSDGGSNVLPSELVKKLFNEVYSNNYEPNTREFTSESIENVFLPNGAINFDSPNKTTRFDLTTNNQVLTLSDPELSFLLKNPQVNIFLDLENCSNHSLNESMQNSTVIDLSLDESCKSVTKSRKTQTYNKKSISSDMEQQKNSQASMPKELIKSKSKAISELGEQLVEKVSINENCNNSVSLNVSMANGLKPKNRPGKKTKKSAKRQMKNKFTLSEDAANKGKIGETANGVNKLSNVSQKYDKPVATNPPVKKYPRKFKKTNGKSAKLPLNKKIKLNEDGNKSAQTQVIANMKEAEKSDKGLKEPIPRSKCNMSEKCDKPNTSNSPTKKPPKRPRKNNEKSAKLPLNKKIKLNEDGNKSAKTQVIANMKEAEKSDKGLKEPNPRSKCNMSEKCDKPNTSNSPAKKPPKRPRKNNEKSAKLSLNKKVKPNEDGNESVQTQDAANMKEAEKSDNGLKQSIPRNKCTMSKKCDKSYTSNAQAKKPPKRPGKRNWKSAKLPLNKKIKLNEDENKYVQTQDAANIKKAEKSDKGLKEAIPRNKCILSEKYDRSNTSNAQAKKPPKRPGKRNWKSAKLPLNKKIKLNEDENKYVQTQDAANIKKAEKSDKGLKEPIPRNKCNLSEKYDKSNTFNSSAKKLPKRPGKNNEKSAKLPSSKKIKLNEVGNKPVPTQDAATMKEAEKSDNGLKQPTPRNKCNLNQKCDKSNTSNVPAKKPPKRPGKSNEKSAKLSLNNKIKLSEDCNKFIHLQDAAYTKEAEKSEKRLKQPIPRNKRNSEKCGRPITFNSPAKKLLVTNIKMSRAVVRELQKDTEKCHTPIFANSTKKIDKKLNGLSKKSKSLQATAKRPIKRPREMIEKSENPWSISGYKLRSSLNDSSNQDDRSTLAKRPRGRSDQFELPSNVNDIKSINLSIKGLETYSRTEPLQVNSKRRVSTKTNLNSSCKSLKNIPRARKYSPETIEKLRSHAKKNMSNDNLNTSCSESNETSLKVDKAQSSGSSQVSTISSEELDISLNRRILRVELETLKFDKCKPKRRKLSDISLQVIKHSKRGMTFKSEIVERVPNETRTKHARKVKIISSTSKNHKKFKNGLKHT